MAYVPQYHGELLTWYLEYAISNPVVSVSCQGWSKTLNKCTIHCGVCSSTQSWCEGSSICSKPSHTRSYEGNTRWSTSRYGACCVMCQQTLTAPSHSPDGDSIQIPSNSTSEGEGITRTGGGRPSELSSNNTWREKCMKTFTSSLSTQLDVQFCFLRWWWWSSSL